MSTARTRGFTLIELLVVMAVLAMALLVVPPMFSKGMSTVSLKSAARGVAAGLRQARSDAIVQNREVTFVIDVEQRHYRIDDHPDTHGLPETVEIALFTAESETIDEVRGRIRFFPDGSSTGGGITLGNDGRTYQVLVDWLTGQVSIVE